MAKYTVYLFGERFEHRSIEAARKRAIDALNYCQPPHNQIIDESGKQVSIFPPQVEDEENYFREGEEARRKWILGEY